MVDLPEAPAATLVIFGGTGDLTRRLLIPALVNLCADGLIGDDLQIIGIGSRDGDDETLRAGLDEFAPEGECWPKLRGRISYLSGDFTQDAIYGTLKGKVSGNAAFYLAVAPQFFGPIVEKLGQAELLAQADDAFRRVLIEKPFGHDLASAQALNQQILAQVGEDQVYRIDHFLGKETVQNIMVARFANTLFEAVWDRDHIDHVQITAAETVDVGTRGAFYDATGATRDMVPNHLMQLLAMIGMDAPNNFGAEAVRTEKAKLLSAIRRATADEARDDAVRGRYTEGRIGERQINAYLATDQVKPDSTTETYVALRLFVDTWRWAGVPFYLRPGKALSARDKQIVIQFKPTPYACFRERPTADLPPNRLVLQLQPDEGISLCFEVKQPGPAITTAPVSLDFSYQQYFTIGGRTGYETLLYDMFVGDQTLFQRADQIEAGWEAVQPFLDAWEKGEGKLEDYAPGTAGPSGADILLARDGRAWHALG